MATYSTSRQHVFQNENSEAFPKKTVVDGKSKIPKTATKKGGLGKGSRKALNDITNKSNIRLVPEASINKRKAPEEEFKFAEEGCLHDHKKCTEAQQKAMRPSFLDIVLPGHDSDAQTHPTEPFVRADSDAQTHPTEAELEDEFYPEPVEMPMDEFSDWLKPSTRWDSPLSSPINWDSPPCSPLALHFEPVEFKLKELIDV